MPQLNTKTKYFNAKRIATLSVLCAMGLIMFMVESLFPPLFLPGAKMGLSNVFSLLTLFVLGPVDALVVVIVRTVLGSLFGGGISTLMYSLTAGVVSVVISAFLVEFVYPNITIIAISIVSAICHNITQNVVFCLISNTPEMFSYMPCLALVGVLAGVIVGFGTNLILRALPSGLVLSLQPSLDPTEMPTKTKSKPKVVVIETSNTVADEPIQPTASEQDSN
jgi:heptaprenyl diphosphate synthase